MTKHDVGDAIGFSVLGVVGVLAIVGIIFGLFM